MQQGTAGVPGMAELLSRHRLPWLGHLARMSNDHGAKQALFGHEVSAYPHPHRTGQLRRLWWQGDPE